MEPTAPGTASSRGPRPPISRETLEGVRRRDRDALGRLFERHVDELYLLALRLLGDRHEAEEVVQKVFLKVHRAAHQLDPERDPAPWLITITYNACREHRRTWSQKLDRRSESIDEEGGAGRELAAAGHDPEAALLRGEREARLVAAIGKLPEASRDVVWLHAVHGLRHEEIADAMGTSAAAVRKRYSRSLALLREELEERSE